MSNIRVGDLAVVVKGFGPNIGRVVFVTKYVADFDFSFMGLGRSAGWRVRSWSAEPLETIGGLRTVGITPLGSLRRLDRLPPPHQREIELQMAQADFDDALSDLAKIMQVQPSTAQTTTARLAGVF